MAISNFTELQSAIDNLLKLNGSSEFIARIPEWISLCESEANRTLRVFRQEKLEYADYTLSNTTRRLGLPNDFVEVLGLEIRPQSFDDLNYESCRYVAQDQINEKYVTEHGQPLHYTIRRGEIEFDRFPSEDMRVRMHYISKWDIGTDATNWLLTNYPDVYLYGVAYHGAIYRWDDKRAEVFKKLFNAAMGQVNLVDERSRDDAELDVTEIGRLSNRRYREYSSLRDTV